MRNIFVVGTGRSGTHLLCRTLLTFANGRDFLGGVEDKTLLSAVTSAAIEDRPLDAASLATLGERSRRAAESGGIFLDQSHPLLWFVERLLESMPNSLFIVPWRPNEQVLASMLHHAGVVGWYSRLQAGTARAAFPSRFFGIDSVAAVSTLSIAELCLARVVSHKRECRRLQSLLGPQYVRFVDYENLVARGGDAVEELLTPQERSKLGPRVGRCVADARSLRKYAEVLTAAQIEMARSCEV